MRKIIRLVLAVIMLFIGSFQAQASEQITADIYFNRAGMKMLSGVANMATGWMELPKILFYGVKKIIVPWLVFLKECYGGLCIQQVVYLG